MKRQFFLFFALVVCSNAFAQTEQEPTDSEKRLDAFTDAKRHELSLDVGAALIIPAFQPRYEYILGRYSGLGVDLFIDLSDNDADYSEIEKFSVTPFYRQYFFSKEDYGAKGFYAEGFLKAYTFDDTIFDDTFPAQFPTEDTYFETALGVGIGWKWVSNSGFMIDLGFGIGRNLGFADIPDDARTDIVPRGGVHFGWRF